MTEYNKFTNNQHDKHFWWFFYTRTLIYFHVCARPFIMKVIMNITPISICNKVSLLTYDSVQNSSGNKLIQGLRDFPAFWDLMSVWLLHSPWPVWFQISLLSLPNKVPKTSPSSPSMSNPPSPKSPLKQPVTVASAYRFSSGHKLHIWNELAVKMPRSQTWKLLNTEEGCQVTGAVVHSTSIITGQYYVCMWAYLVSGF